MRIALLLLRGYKIFVSPYFRGSCRFVPSCADYAAEAVERHGLLTGCWLTARRLRRAIKEMKAFVLEILLDTALAVEAPWNDLRQRSGWISRN